MKYPNALKSVERGDNMEERTLMKIAAPVLGVAALGLVLGGCPKGNKDNIPVPTYDRRSLYQDGHGSNSPLPGYTDYINQ